MNLKIKFHTKQFNPEELKNLYIPPPDSHKGMSGKLTIIGGSHLFHGASLWALKIASRIVDMVFYSSVEENNAIAQKLKEQFFDCIVVPRENVEEYIKQSDAVLIGPGLTREDGKSQDEEPTRELTHRLLEKFPNKKWVIDAGSLQTMDPEWLKQLHGNAIVTPHDKEFENLFDIVIASTFDKLSVNSAKPGTIRYLAKQSQEILNQVRNDKKEIASPTCLSSRRAPSLRSVRSRNDIVSRVAREYNCVILFKGEKDVVCSPTECVEVAGGNAGMTKGGTGDVLAGLVAALSCKNDVFLAAKAGSFINKKAGDNLFRKVGPYFNASDLCDEIPKVLKELIIIQ
ncbi:MAG: hypothetical protein A3F31_00370 [Candidatus Levybacteria bacterium RIFCSPHIGHO2_12_FULL_38_12]|nr:MAG: hypothetical protein A2770_03440 [Candidatus Levybacteria bacterium RIFCSPHIGHO2_01_FULL_38_12]OGH23213.1 MAG: hypothetical protein A3F31_00370 [Candidatus Levybacteria bacterium RIFCSPHIGHO2_12_FULL_38_12]OGH34491.1 MAG: hypothetical protein A3A47_00890 [Candidatus Levybacteria bacterium RIFCSPLOWO2_01_FULL_37_20]OGH44739.1 MAG: hypothetical protein A3J14_00250 [Candidatus Levybacteria bacterium RIFCSPLOWO2_02_FULL_37_18]